MSGNESSLGSTWYIIWSMLESVGGSPLGRFYVIPRDIPCWALKALGFKAIVPLK